MKFTTPPVGIDQKTWDFLYQTVEKLNLMLETVEAGGGNGAIAAARPADVQAALDKEAAENDEYAALKALVVKTANTTTRNIQTLTERLTGEYVAISDFGTYVQQLSSQIEANPESITQYYSFFSDLQSNVQDLQNSIDDYKISTEAYIRTGIVYFENDVPVYGVAVGQDLTSSSEVDGVAVVDPTQFRAIFTAQELSFWQGDTKVAYVSNNQLYINDIVAIESVQIGRWEVGDSHGLTFKWIGG